jgi:hypothetical protein
MTLRIKDSIFKIEVNLDGTWVEFITDQVPNRFWTITAIQMLKLKALYPYYEYRIVTFEKKEKEKKREVTYE